MEKIGRSDSEQADAGDVVSERFPGGQRLGRDGARIDDCRLRPRRRLTQPVAALHRARLPAFVRPRDLGDRAGGEAEIDALAILGLHAPEALLHQQRKLIDEGGLVMAEARLAQRDQRRVDRLVGAAFRAKGDARGRGDQHEARILVAGVIERIEAAGDERVVDGADWEQPLAEHIAGEA